jgi:hypothetical protein
MTTTVHLYSSCVHSGTKLQIVRRSTGPLAEGASHSEEVLDDSLEGHRVVTHHVWDGCELVVREVPVAAEEEKS